jgi:hypothetical protein
MTFTQSLEGACMQLPAVQQHPNTIIDGMRSCHNTLYTPHMPSPHQQQRCMAPPRTSCSGHWSTACNTPNSGVTPARHCCCSWVQSLLVTQLSLQLSCQVLSSCGQLSAHRP